MALKTEPRARCAATCQARDRADWGTKRQCPRYALEWSEFCKMHGPDKPKRDKRGRIVKVVPAVVDHEADDHDYSACATCAAIDPHQTENGDAGVNVDRWEVMPLTEDGRYVVRDMAGTRIASAGTDLGIARKIAAVPDLLVAAKLIMEWADNAGIGNNSQRCNSIGKMRAAIIRAEGK